MPADPTAALARVRAALAEADDNTRAHVALDFADDSLTVAHLRTLLALAEAAVEETRAEQAVESSWTAFNRAVNLEDERKARQTAIGGEATLRYATEHRRALARGEG